MNADTEIYEEKSGIRSIADQSEPERLLIICVHLRLSAVASIDRNGTGNKA